MFEKSFISIEGILYLLFVSIDLFAWQTGRCSDYLKYTSILLCFFYILFCKENKNTGDLYIVCLAIFFTLIADTCIVLIHNNTGGMLSFIVVQLLYWYRLNDYCLRRMLPVAVVGSFIVLLLFLAGVPMEPVIVFATFYFTLFSRNVIYGILKGKNRMFVIGLCLFFLCDINVGLYNIEDYITVNTKLYDVVYAISSVAIWGFYLPSQVLICLSIKEG